MESSKKKLLRLMSNGDAMSVSFMEYLIALRSSDLSGPVRALAVWIASRCSDGWPVTLDGLVKDSGFSRSTVKRAIDQLELVGWLARSTGRRKGNTYELSIPASRVVENPQKVQDEPSDGNSRFTANLQKGHGEPTVGSQRASQLAHSEPTYIRTKQEQKRTEKTAREIPINFDAVSDRALVRSWVVALTRDVDLADEVGSEYRNAAGGIDIPKLSADVYANSQVFDRFKWCFQELRAKGVI